MEQRYIARTSGLKFKDYLGYGLIDTAGCLIFSLVTTLLQKYYTDILHLSPLFIMLMFIGARIWDAINDPIMGRIADTRTPKASGRYRPWVLYAAIPLAITGVLMFDDAGTALMLAIFALQDSFGTACNVTGDGALTLFLTGYAERHHIAEGKIA